MPYEQLKQYLADSASPTVTTLPDGSIDYYCTVSGGSTEPLETRESLAREILGDRTSLQFQIETTEPGGQAVNTAKQLHAFGGDVTCYGHLDAPIFDSLPFETVSMGDPSRVYVFKFAERDLMFANNSDVTTWTFEDLQQVGEISEVFDADVICCSNWVSVSGLESAFHRLSEKALPRIPFVFDPGDILGSEHEKIEALHDALAALQDTFDVVYNANRGEIRTTAAPLGDSFEEDIERLAAIQRTTGITAAVLHAREEAAVATSEERTSVKNYDVSRPERHTGGGDRFTGGLGHALACGWDWDVALACGNACAVYHVESGETGTADDIIGFIEDRTAAGAK
jgi:sugar/nucleoside kinase (ribokinase family)